LTTSYKALLEKEQTLVEGLRKRLEEVITASEALAKNDNAAVKTYFERKLNRVILEYLLHARNFQIAEALTNEADLAGFSDAACYLEMAQILAAIQEIIDTETPRYTYADEIKTNAQKSKALDAALAWCA